MLLIAQVHGCKFCVSSCRTKRLGTTSRINFLPRFLPVVDSFSYLVI